MSRRLLALNATIVVIATELLFATGCGGKESPDEESPIGDSGGDSGGDGGSGTDNDGDGYSSSVDCDDDDPSSTVVANDADCDGVV
ncbi:MAG TPA: hypothetical protein DFR83_09460, partial [Deltaproteobacteria bacterium]|nr:hypothetical protein [Deltaproteobacteria bacterium]